MGPFYATELKLAIVSCGGEEVLNGYTECDLLLHAPILWADV